jgi:hypothetical protein
MFKRIVALVPMIALVTGLLMGCSKTEKGEEEKLIRYTEKVTKYST